MRNIVLLTNIMTPYRKFFYDELYAGFKKRNIEFHVVLMASTEPNRNWNYEDYKASYTDILPGKTVFNKKGFIHINYKIKKTFQKLKPDVVICAGSYLYPALWRTLKLSRHMKFMVYYWSESHLGEIRNYSNKKIAVREWIRKKVIGKFDGFWYAGRLSKEFIQCYADSRAKYIHVPNLIDNNKFDNNINQFTEKQIAYIKKKYELSIDKKILFTPARLSKEKGILDFLNLYKDVLSKNNAIYIIAGEGEIKGLIENFCLEHSLEVRLLGYKKETEIVELYAITDIFVLPSLSDPNPLTCIEACWSSLPMLVSKHVGNYPEIINEGINGYVLDYEDVNISINKINKMIEANKEWISCAKEYSYLIAKKNYFPKMVTDRVIKQLIEQVGDIDEKY